MNSRFAVLAVGLGLAGCVQSPPVDTANPPFGAFGTMDNDIAAINQATWAFAAASRTANDPVDGARAVAAVDYLGGELTSNFRWMDMSPVTKQEMLQARADVRTVLGIPQNAPSQVVVMSLLTFAFDWQQGNQAGAMQALSTPVFTLGPQQTFAILANLPQVPSANIASLDASQQMDPAGGNASRHR